MLMLSTNKFAASTRQSALGFTLIELMMAVFLAAVLLTLAVPSFDRTITSNRVQTHARDLASALSFARSEAVARSSFIGICGSADQANCNASNDWSSGWIVFMDDGAGSATSAAFATNQGDGDRTNAEEVLRVYQHSGANELLVIDSDDTAVNSITFSPRGGVVQEVNLTLKICEDDDRLEYARAVLLQQTGRAIRSFDLNDSGGSAAPDGIFEDVNGDNLTCS